MPLLILFSAIAALLGLAVVIYIIVGIIFFITTALRVPFLISARRATVKLTTSLVLSYFILSFIILISLITLGMEKYFLSNYPFIDTLATINKGFPLLDIMNELSYGLGGKLTLLIPYKIFEAIFIWGLFFIIIFITNLILSPLRAFMANREIKLFKTIPITLAFLFTLFIVFAGIFSLKSTRMIDDRFPLIELKSIVDSRGLNRGIFYKTYNQDSYRYVINNRRWKVNVIDFGFETFKNYEDISTVIDSKGFLHISSFRFGEGLLYLTNKDTGWQVNEIDNSNAGDYSSITLDKDEKLHVSYYDYDHERIKYANNRVGEWEAENVNVKGEYYLTSLVVDSHNIPYIFSFDRNVGNLACLIKTDNGWIKEIVDYSLLFSESDIGSPFAKIFARVDTNDNIHVCYMDIRGNKVKYSSKIDGIWENEIVNLNDSSIKSDLSMAIDQKGEVHISFITEDGNLHYTKKVKGKWRDREIKKLKANSVVLCVNKNGRPYLYNTKESKGDIILWSNGLSLP